MKDIRFHKGATSYKICILEDFFWAYLKVSDLKMSFWCLQIFQNNFFLVSSKRSNQKNKGTLYHSHQGHKK